MMNKLLFKSAAQVTRMSMLHNQTLMAMQRQSMMMTQFSMMNFSTDNNDNRLRTIILSNIGQDSTSDSIRSQFERFGSVVNVNILRHNKENISDKAFVEFEEASTANSAVEELGESGVNIDDADVTVGKLRDRNHPQSKEGRRLRTVYVRNIQHDLTYNQVQDFFSSRVGEVEYCGMPRSEIEGKNRGFCFITFVKQEDAIKALEQSGTVYEGREISVFPKNKDRRDREEEM